MKSLYSTAVRAAGLLISAGLLASTISCTHLPARPERTVGGLRLIGEQRIPLKQVFHDTLVGGISGIDYDPASGLWALESDDRSHHNPARFYLARLDYDAGAFHALALQDTHAFRQPDGSLYPGVKEFDAGPGGEVPDIEAIRFDPLEGGLWYVSEGDRPRGLQPFVRSARRDGTHLASLPLPAMLRYSKDEIGMRDNLAFEGLSFAPDGKSLWLSLEGPLYQDGPLPTPVAGAAVRITQLDRKGAMLAQYAYPLDPIPDVPGPGKVADNGVAEILAINGHTLLVLERSAVQNGVGIYYNHVRLYAMELNGATDISALPALAGASYRPAAKRLVLDFDKLGIRIDNLEAVSWGPKLANGHDTLVLASDDNFGKTQITQFLAFEVLP